MNDCIFCRIISGDIPSKKVYEDDQVLAFLDIHPKAPGHTMLIPKKHYRWFIDMPENEWASLMQAAQTVSKKLKNEYGADFIRLGVVGTDMPHVHVHLIPQQMHEVEPKI
jgi:histidine triad (HIT) family protein